LVIAGLIGCGGDDDDATVGSDAGTTAVSEQDAAVAPTTTDQVTIVDFAFDPEDVTVPVGATVRWTNQDAAPHSVEDRTLDFESEELALGDGFERTYEDAGSYPYVCGIHNYMQGTITVR